MYHTLTTGQLATLLLAFFWLGGMVALAALLVLTPPVPIDQTRQPPGPPSSFKFSHADPR